MQAAGTIFEAAATLDDGEEAQSNLGNGRVFWERDGNRFVVTFVPTDPRVEPFTDTFELVDGECDTTPGNPLVVNRCRFGDRVFVRAWRFVEAYRPGPSAT